MSSPGEAPLRFRVGLAAAVVAGALIRLIYLLQIRGNPFFAHPIADAAHFDRWAAQIAGGDLFGTGPFFRPPLYGYLLGLAYWLFGRDFLVVRLVQFAIGLTGVVATAELARRLWQNRAGIVTAWLLALYPTVIYYEGELLSDFLLVTITPLLVLAVLAAVQSGRRHAFVVAGLLTGVFAVIRPNILAAVPLLAAWLIGDLVRQHRWRPAVTRVGLYISGLALVIAPVTTRNVLVGHDTIWIAWQGGVNFAVGNHPGADGVSAALPPWGTAWTVADITGAAETTSGRTLKPSQVSAYWAKQGWRFWQDSPGAALRLLGHKVLLFWQNAEYANNQSRDWFINRWGPVLRWLPLSFGLLVALGSIGWWSVRRSSVHCWTIGFTMLYSLTIAIFFVTDRFRLPVIPIWAGAAAAGLVWSWDQARRRAWRTFGTALVLASALFIVGRVDFLGLSTESLPRSYLALGNIQLESGQTAAALASFDTALTFDPNYPGLWLSRGAAHYRAGWIDSSAADFRRELSLRPTLPQAMTNLAIVELDCGDTVAATAFLDKALAAQPRFLPAALAKARILRSQRHPDAAYRVLQTSAGTGIDVDGLMLMGVILLDLGRLEAADSLFTRVIAARARTPGSETSPDVPHLLAPPDPRNDLALAHYNRGVIAGLRGQWRDATRELGVTIALNPRLAQAWSNLSSAYIQMNQDDSALAAAQRAVQLAPDNPVYLSIRAVSYLAIADTASALADARSALAHDSAFIPARALLLRVGHGQQ